MRNRSDVRWFVAASALLALAYRVWSALGATHKGDALVIANMANDIARGAGYPLSFYGQHYMGAIEAWITAPLFMVTGPTWWGVSFAPILVSVIGVIPFYLLGSTIAGKRAGLAAALLWAITPLGATAYNITPRGCYPEVVCGGTFLLWFGVKRWNGDNFGHAASFFTGLLAGVLVWTSLLSAPYVITMALFILAADRLRFFNIKNMLGAAGVALGAAPFYLMGGAIGDKGVGKTDVSHLMENAMALATTVANIYPPYASLNPPALLNTVGYSLAWVMGGLALLGLLAALFGMVTRRGESPGARSVPLIVFTIIFITLYITNAKATQYQARYALPLQTAIIVSSGAVIAWLWRVWKPAGIAVLSFILAVNTAINWHSLEAGAAINDDSRRLIGRFVDGFEKLGVKSIVFDEYDLMRQVTYEALTRGVTLNGMGMGGSRNLMETLEVEKDPYPGFVTFKGPATQNFTRWIEACCGADYKVDEVADRSVVHHIRPKSRPAISIPPDRWDIPAELQAVGDRRFDTTLASSASFTIGLKEPETITRIRLIYGNRRPAANIIQFSMDGEKWETISGPNPPSAFLPAGPKVFMRVPWGLEREYEEWSFPPHKTRFVRFEMNVAPSRVYDIHELFLYSPAPEKAPAAPVDEIIREANMAGVKILAADRWTLARLMTAPGRKFEMVQTSLRAVNTSLAKSAWKIKKGWGALVEIEDAAELRARLKEKDIIFSARAMGAYTLFTFGENRENAWWTGFTLLDFPSP